MEDENFHKGTLTEPKKHVRNVLSVKSFRGPLAPVSSTNGNQINCIKDSPGKKLSLSEPINIKKVRSRIIENSKISSDEAKVPKNKQQPKIDVKTLAKLLDYDTFIEEKLKIDEVDETKMFKFLEKEGRLSSEILKLFSKCPKIRSVNMTHSYAGILDESGLLSAAKYSSKMCTKSFYCGFQQVLSIDLTNVKIEDDELRYLIKLPKLQALGLSGTSITDKGIKYLSVHSAFIKALKCLKICYVQGITDNSMKFLNSFAKLKELDLRGCENISLQGCLDLVEEFPNLSRTEFSIKLPLKIQSQLKELHLFYKRLSEQNSNFILDPNDVRIENLTETELKFQLKLHQKVNRNVYLNEEKDSLRKKLIYILRIRRKEELLFNFSFNES